MNSASKFKFAKLNVRAARPGPGGAREIRWSEWFCLDETWRHPYNRGTPRAKEFQEWCRKNWQPRRDAYSPVCPEVKIGGQRLNDGWGSDVVGRIACFLDDRDCRLEDEIADAVEAAMATGEARTVSRTGLEVKVEPFEEAKVDRDSLDDFGPFAADAAEGLVAEPFEPEGGDKIVVRRTRADGTAAEFAITLDQLADFVLSRAEDALVTENGESLETYSSRRRRSCGY